MYAHTIRGAGRNVGVQSLADIADDLESASGEGDIETLMAIFDTVKAELDKVMTFLSRPDWIEVVKQKKVITEDILCAAMAAG